jgi:hypothetical protein
MYCDPSIAVAGKRPVRSENKALARRSDGFRMHVCKIVVGSSCSSYWSSASGPTVGRSGELFSDVSLADEECVLVGKISGAGRRSAWFLVLVGKMSGAGRRLVDAGAGRRWAWFLVLVCKIGGAGRRLAGDGERWAWTLVVARASWAESDGAGRLGAGVRFRCLLTGDFGVVDRIPDRDAVMCPSAVAGLCGWLRLRIFAVSDG